MCIGEVYALFVIVSGKGLKKTGEKETWVDNVDFYQSSSGSRIRNHSALLDTGGICA